jgi:anti-anti-sigma factor
MGVDSGFPASRLFISTPVRDSGRIHLSVAGDIDMTTGDRFTVALTEVLDQPDLCTLELDLGRLHFIDSNGVTALIRGHWAARERGVTLTIRNAVGPIRETLQMLGVYDLLTETTPSPRARPESG